MTNKSYRSLEIQITKSNKLWKSCDTICHNSSHLYNKINYLCRQKYFECGRIPDSKILYQQIKDEPEWRLNGHKNISIQTLRNVINTWQSYFSARKSYNSGTAGFTGKPKIPGYKHRDSGRFATLYQTQSTGSPISMTLLEKNTIRLLGNNKIQFAIPSHMNGKDVKIVNIVPNLNHYSIIITYEVEIMDTISTSSKSAMDLGVNNLCAITFSQPNKVPILVNGRHIKSINQYYNKKLAYLNSKLPQNVRTSKAIKTLTRKRNNKIKNELHQISKSITDLMKSNNVDELIIGKNNGWKQNINIGKKNNQKFVGIPYNKLIFQISYKLESVGIKTTTNEESYTSKASFLDLDFIPTYAKSETKYQFSGKRVRRGLYKSKSGHLINADINASYNIMRKVVPKVFDNGIEGVVVHPLTLNRSGITSIKVT